jgi:hypothetical protein
VFTEPPKEAPRQPSGGPLFVVGVPRSGTSLLHILLNQHPDIGLAYEADLPMLLPLFLRRRSKTRWLERWNLYNEGPQRHQINISKIPSELLDIKAATRAVYQEYSSHKSAAIWGDKSPNQYDALIRLADYFPDASFIIIWRDPADVCRSIIRARTQSIRFKQQHAENALLASPHFAHGGMVHRGLLAYPELGRQRDELLQRGIPVHELHYEVLVKQPAEEMQKISHFLRIPFYPRMASLQGADSSAVPWAEHNTMAKGETIVAPQKRVEVLSPKLQRKIARYKNLWREKKLDWATFAASREDTNTPSLPERVFDRLRFRLLRAWDSFVIFGYCLAPLRVLLAYRSWRGHPYLNLTWQEYVRSCLETHGSKEEAVTPPLEHDEAVMSVDSRK